MKKILSFLVCLFIIYVFCNADAPYDFENQEYFFRAYYSELKSPPFRFAFLSGDFFMDIPELDKLKREYGKDIKETIYGKYSISIENNFLYITVLNKKYLVLYTGFQVCVLIDCDNGDTFFGLNKDSKNVGGRAREGIFVGITGTTWYGKFPENSVSSFLTETVRGEIVKYNGSHEKYYYELKKPWVEGKPGYGIGEWVERSPDGNTYEILFFNGYIDPNRPDLFYANSRVKEVVVSCGQDNWTFLLEDTPNPQILTLSHPIMTSLTLRFTIKDVYRGERYSDTCITGIYFLREQGK
jgi:hypothetical protein